MGDMLSSPVRAAPPMARDAPELPFGYAGSILLALAPPLWRRVMDEKALAWRAP